MPTGTVKWFNNAKGYGFILPDQGGEDLFAHYTSIEMEGYKTLKAGQVVSYETVKGGKGLHATHIKSPDSVATSQSKAQSKEETPPPSRPGSVSKDSEIEAVS